MRLGHSINVTVDAASLAHRRQLFDRYSGYGRCELNGRDVIVQHLVWCDERKISSGLLVWQEK